MKKSLKAALIGLALGATAGGATAAVGSEETTARPCYSDCEAGYGHCVVVCGIDSDCYVMCGSNYDSCLSWCSFSC
jgi:hypothetical protein